MNETPDRRAPGRTWIIAGLIGIHWAMGLGATAAFAQDVVVDRDIVYYDPGAPDFCAPKHILDVYRLDGAENLPVLVFIHGGGWTGGDKNMFGYLGNFFARSGFVTVLANYRLTDNSDCRVVHPGHIQDVARAFAWTFANIANYGGNPQTMFVSGHSAGGHLVSLLAVDPRYLADHVLSPDNIAGVISVSGVYDVRGIGQIFGDPEQQQDASPRFHVGDAPLPPFLVLHAGKNDLGGPDGLGRQAVDFNGVLYDLPADSADTAVYKFAGRNHGTIIGQIANPGDEVGGTMLEFMFSHLGPG